MRSPTSRAALLAAAAAALSACGNYSTEDLRFYAALPTRADLRVEVPIAAAQAAALARPTAACALGTAQPWLEARAQGDNINATVDWLIGLVDAVRRVDPTTRLDDGRVWGPFDDEKHPGFEIKVVINRTRRDDGRLQYVYAFQGHRKGATAPFQDVLAGAFTGPSASHGEGSLALDFEATWAIGMNDADTPHARIDVTYDRTVDPRTTHLILAAAGAFGLQQQFDYQYKGYADGRGLFRYLFQKPGLLGGTDTLQVSASFAADGAGRGEIGFLTAGGATGGFSQCWGADACLAWHEDLTGYSCGGAPSCVVGAESACPAVEAPLPLVVLP